VRVRSRGSAARVRVLLDVLWAGSGLILTGVVVTALAAALYAARNPTYSATSQVLLRSGIPPDLLKPVGGVDVEVAPPELDLGVETEAALVGSPVVAGRVARSIGLPAPPDPVEATVLTGSLIEVRASAPDPLLAAVLANSFADQYLAYRREAATRVIAVLTRNLDMRAAQLRTRINKLDDELELLETTSARSLPGNGLEVRQERDRLLATLQAVDTRVHLLAAYRSLQTADGDVVARATAPPHAPLPATAAAAGAMLGGTMGCTLALLRHTYARGRAAPADLGRTSGMRVLAAVPADPRAASLRRGPTRLDEPAVLLLPRSAAANAYQMLYATLTAEGLGRTLRRLLLVSLHPGEGRPVAAANLAMLCANAGLPVVVISADARDPVLPQLLGEASHHDPAGPLGNDTDWVANLTLTETPNLMTVALGRADGGLATALTRPRLRQILDDAARLFRVVLVDAPPLTDGLEAVMLAAEGFDAVLLVVPADGADPAALADAAQLLELSGVPLRGMVITAAPEAGGSP
jgi:Mrp family chromosome partitioning ATPase